MAWTKKRSPLLPDEPVYHSPTRCFACSHEQAEHDRLVKAVRESRLVE